MSRYPLTPNSTYTVLGLAASSSIEIVAAAANLRGIWLHRVYLFVASGPNDASLSADGTTIDIARSSGNIQQTYDHIANVWVPPGVNLKINTSGGTTGDAIVNYRIL